MRTFKMKFNEIKFKDGEEYIFLSSIVINVSTIVLLISISNDSPTDTRSSITACFHFKSCRDALHPYNVSSIYARRVPGTIYTYI